ncbi:uncharacterized protein [Rutidosis leptorrhynchoides]|uniref:uncharacterized protein isoform X2 n=1 Tax=Rutidosis leptorrhynchoides TaxID=125765 RepID=UPI003A98CEBB
MSSDDLPDWLPADWFMKVREVNAKKVKCYIDPEGHRFYSKPQVFEHLKKNNSGTTSTNTHNADGSGVDTSMEQDVDPTNGEGSPIPIIATPISAWKSDPDMSESYETPKVEKNTTRTKIGSARLSAKYEVVSRTPVEGLPSGWIMELRRRTRGAVKTDPYFLDPLSEYVFFSKKDALRYLESGDVKNCVIKPVKRDMNEDSHNANLSSAGGEMASKPVSIKTETPEPLTTNGIKMEMETNDASIECPKPLRSISGGYFSTRTPKEEISDWLPERWAVEVHYKSSGMQYKVYKDSASGKKFYSKPQVLSYLSNGTSSNSRKRKGNKPVANVGRPKGSKKKNDDTQKSKSNCEEVVTASPADGLPHGWIKEIRTKIYATHQRRDPFYTDPVSGYIFRSKLDAMRYLETGDINLCAIRPKMKDKDGNEVFVVGSVQKPATAATNNQLNEGENNDSSIPARSSGMIKFETGPSSGRKIGHILTLRSKP